MYIYLLINILFKDIYKYYHYLNQNNKKKIKVNILKEYNNFYY